MNSALKKIRGVNESLAAWGTRTFGTMFVFWICFFYGLIAVLPSLSKYQSVMLYWSNWVQLWALPLLMVGGIVLNRASEARAEKDHRTVTAILDDQTKLLVKMDTVMSELSEVTKELNSILKERNTK